MKLVPAQLGICSFEVIQLGSSGPSESELGRAKMGGHNSCNFSVEEELLCKTRNCGGSVVLHDYFFYISINGPF